MTVLAVSMLSGNKLYRPFLYFQVYTLHTLEIKNCFIPARIFYIINNMKIFIYEFLNTKPEQLQV